MIGEERGEGPGGGSTTAEGEPKERSSVPNLDERQCLNIRGRESLFHCGANPQQACVCVCVCVSIHPRGADSVEVSCGPMQISTAISVGWTPVPRYLGRGACDLHTYLADEVHTHPCLDGREPVMLH